MGYIPPYSQHAMAPRVDGIGSNLDYVLICSIHILTYSIVSQPKLYDDGMTPNKGRLRRVYYTLFLIYYGVLKWVGVDQTLIMSITRLSKLTNKYLMFFLIFSHNQNKIMMYANFFLLQYS